MANALTENWPEWTAITTQWNDPGGEDPDEYTAYCYRCQDANRTPNTFSGTLAECIPWAQGHEGDPDPNAKPPTRKPKGA